MIGRKKPPADLGVGCVHLLCIVGTFVEGVGHTPLIPLAHADIGQLQQESDVPVRVKGAGTLACRAANPWHCGRTAA